MRGLFKLKENNDNYWVKPILSFNNNLSTQLNLEFPSKLPANFP